MNPSDGPASRQQEKDQAPSALSRAPDPGPPGLGSARSPISKGSAKSGQRSLTSRVWVHTPRSHPCLKLPLCRDGGKGRGFHAGIFRTGPSFSVSIKMPSHPLRWEAAVATLPSLLRAAGHFLLLAPPRTLPQAGR